jgi:acetyltransferase-like isoleucine patch superfamily enzyme
MKFIVYLKRLYRLIADPKLVSFKLRGENVVIEPNCKFGLPENIEIGSNVKIGEGTSIFAQGGLCYKKWHNSCRQGGYKNSKPPL